MKNSKVAQLVQPFRELGTDPHYLAFFDCFNRGLFFEAHEVLEAIWLPERGKPRDLFYKGLIQLAGAFVHLQKQRRSPAMALFRLARTNLARFTPAFGGVEVSAVIGEIDKRLDRLDQGGGLEAEGTLRLVLNRSYTEPNS